MSTRTSPIEMRKNTFFWDSFFSVFGFNSNPLLGKAKEIAAKGIDQRISESWEITSETFSEVYEKKARVAK